MAVAARAGRSDANWAKGTNFHADVAIRMGFEAEVDVVLG